jgi:hypothetical protein
MATATLAAPPRVTVVRVERAGLPAAMGHELPCSWSGHSHHFVACEDCSCPAHEHYPGEL